VHLEATPPLAEREHRALLLALEQADVGTAADEPYRHAWRVAALAEAALGEEAESAYAFSPRSTRGATRA
jgi:hypothetical protein